MESSHTHDAKIGLPGAAAPAAGVGAVSPQSHSLACPASHPHTIGTDVAMAMTPTMFKRIKLLGRGDVGRVYLAQLVGTDKFFAVKVLPKKEMIERNKVKRVYTEREILYTANHPFIVTLYWSFASSNCLYFVMEYLGGGEFFRMMQRQPGHCLQEQAAKFYGAEVLLALEYLHMLGFIYRDLKPQNILMHGSGHIVLTDFDLSKAAAIPVRPKLLQSMFGKERIATEPGIVSNSLVGTAEYIAPEVITGYGHTSSVDWWTYGILMYQMLYGVTPFVGANRQETLYRILHDGENVRFPDEHIYKVSSSAHSLIRQLLQMDPSKRLGAEHGACELKDHSFFKGIKFQMIRNMTPPIVPELQSEFDTQNFPNLQDDDQIDKLEAKAEQQPRTPSPQDPFHDFDSAKGAPAYPDGRTSTPPPRSVSPSNATVTSHLGCNSAPPGDPNRALTPPKQHRS